MPIGFKADKGAAQVKFASETGRSQTVVKVAGEAKLLLLEMLNEKDDDGILQFSRFVNEMREARKRGQ